MRKSRFFLLTALAALLAGTGLAGTPAEASDDRTYVAGVGDLTTVNCSGATAAGQPALGGGCFTIPAGSAYAQITITDAHGEEVPAQAYFRDATATTIPGTTATLCGSRTVPVPTGAVQLTVYISTAFAPLDCELAATAGTTGTISVDWVDDPQGPVANATSGSGSPNVEPVANIPYAAVAGYPFAGGTDIEFFTLSDETGLRRYAVAGTYQNGMHIVDVTDPTTPEVVSIYECRVYQADIQIFTRGARTFVAYAVDDYSNTDIESACFEDVGGFGPDDERYGTFIIEVTDPSAPEAISFVPFAQGSHNTTIDPSGTYLYSSNADLGAPDIVPVGTLEIFDLSDLENPTVANVVDLGLTLPSHDVTFSDDGTRAYVAAITSTLILDTTDPVDPVILGQIVDPSINIHHQADPVTLTDPLLGTRTFVIITDEITGASGNGACPGGGLHVYDVTGDLEATPVPVGFFDLPDTSAAVNRIRCTSHVLRIYPDQGILTIAWYSAGVRVLDISGLVGVSVGTSVTGSVGPGMKQIGWFAFDKTDTWSVKAPADTFEADGSFYMYGNDQLRGFDVYRFDASAPAATEPGNWLDAGELTSLVPAGSASSGGLTLSCVLPGMRA